MATRGKYVAKVSINNSIFFILGEEIEVKSGPL